MKMLANEGVLLIKGIREGEKVEKYFLVYKGEVIASGKKISKQVREIVKKGGKRLGEYLEDLVLANNKRLKSIWKVNRRTINGKPVGKFNCANCALAVDSILAGKPASALPWTYVKKMVKGKIVKKVSFDEGTALFVLEKEFGKTFKKVTIDKIKTTLKPGQRGIVYGHKRGNKFAHVFNVVNENGVIKFLDGQIGTKAQLIYDNYRFLPTNF